MDVIKETATAAAPVIKRGRGRPAKNASTDVSDVLVVVKPPTKKKALLQAKDFANEFVQQGFDGCPPLEITPAAPVVKKRATNGKKAAVAAANGSMGERSSGKIANGHGNKHLITENGQSESVSGFHQKSSVEGAAAAAAAATTTTITPNETSSNSSVLKKRQQHADALLSRHQPIAISEEIQQRVIAQMGNDIGMKVIELSAGCLSRLCAYMTTFSTFQKKNPHALIPSNWFTDPYWDLTVMERTDMLNEAFEIQDDDAKLHDVVEGEFMCRGCKSRRVLLELRQIRSADEAMTQFFTCANCKKKWIVS